MSVFTVRAREGTREIYSGEIEDRLEIGRQQPGEPAPQTLLETGPVPRLIIAAPDVRTIARHQLLVETTATGDFKITNPSSVSKVTLPDTTLLQPGMSTTLAAPVTLRIGNNVELTFDYANEYAGLKSLSQAMFRPGASQWDGENFDGFDVEESLPQHEQASEQLIRYLETMMDVFQLASSATDFYARACRAAINLVGLDNSRVLLLENGEWRTAEQLYPTGGRVRPPSRFVIGQLMRHKKTFWDTGTGGPRPSDSLLDVHAVVAAPILNHDGDVKGILYGERGLRLPGGSKRFTEVTQLHALLLELVACAVSSGLARLQGEDAARRLRLQFEQFFTPTLARHLEQHPDMLNGRDADVSVLFADIRGFSRISEKIGAARTFDWINDVMGTLSECVLRRNGVLVDYIGDELMAMWGAPQQQDDHARLACLAATEMIETIPGLNARWESSLQERFDLGIGISSGPVRAGNMGSHRKFKYGPLGTTVNLASRVQGATKYFKSHLIVTGPTADALGSDFLMRRLADVRVVNLDQPVRLYELPCGDVAKAALLYREYERALEHFEQRDFREAARLLTSMLTDDQEDGPAVILLSRAVEAMLSGADPDHPLWQLPGK